ncbi:MAG: efflux transporter outer membrane subunit [Steroidobacteraceae bacterium]
MKCRYPLALSLLLSGCALGPPPLPPSPPLVAAPLALPDSQAPAESQWPQGKWWQAYGDPALDQLIEQALAGAPGLDAAEARFGAARQNVRAAAAAAGVKVDANAGYQRLRLSENGLFPTEFLGFTQYGQADIGISARYDFDWWGRKRALIESAQDAALASAAETQATALALAAAITESWFGWQADAARIGLLDQQLQTLEQSLQLAQRREAAGLDRGDSTPRLRQAQATVRELRAQLEGSQQLRRLQIAALLGVSEQTLPPFEARPLPAIDARWPADASLDLVARRPDIAASRWRIESARRDLDAIRAEYYPDISIQALAALSSIKLDKLFESSSAAPSLGVALHLPLYDGLRNARHDVAGARLTSVIAQYNQAVVDAAREVATSAAAILQARAQRSQRDEVLTAAEQSLHLARTRARSGLTDARPELDAQLALLREQDTRILLDQAALVADVQLQEALGGGYHYPADTP